MPARATQSARQQPRQPEDQEIDCELVPIALGLLEVEIDERRLPVDALEREQRTDAAAPAALALEEEAADERTDDRPRQQDAGERAAAVEEDQAGGGDPEEQ